MKRMGMAAATALVLVSLAACKQKDDASIDPAAPSTPEATQEASSEPSAAAAFDIEKVPVSTVALGEFPYLTIPSGYRSEGRADKGKAFARFPFWVDRHEQWVEGRFHEYNFAAATDTAQYSPFEVKKNVEAMIQQLGGVQVSEGRIPGETIEKWGDEITMGFIGGIGDIYNEPAITYVVRRNDGNIWVHFVQSTAQGWLVIGQEKAFQQTAQLLPASELKKQIDATGKVALQVNFATDKTDVLPDSMPQIEQIAALLKDDPALKLAINGHTDDSGDTAHNQQLSEGRAKAVVALLVDRGIDAARLTAAGFGSAQPVAENASPEGKAKNRRVELIRVNRHPDHDN